MKFLYPLCIAIFICSCKKSTSQHVKRIPLSEPVISIITAPNNYKEISPDSLLNLFKVISFDTLEIFSPREETDFVPNEEFKPRSKVNHDLLGVVIEPYSLFPTELKEIVLADPHTLFAAYKFNIDSNYTGLIVRTPSYYVSSSLKLLLFDHQKDSIFTLLELAENVGDAGTAFVKNSWIWKDNKSHLLVFIWEQYSRDNSVESENDTTITSWDKYYLIDVSNHVPDTIQKTEKELLYLLQKLRY